VGFNVTSAAPFVGLNTAGVININGVRCRTTRRAA
jgi:hypothetical protein